MKSCKALKEGEGDMSAEIEAKKKSAIQEIITRGKNNGILTYKEIMDALAEFEM
ncbi:MAG: RNA polymerase sigma factor RpoD, partial [Clostridia bacterium]|nr:RNA polymerase sigma factor RpoD [Clostridia bacterium]